MRVKDRVWYLPTLGAGTIQKVSERKTKKGLRRYEIFVIHLDDPLPKHIHGCVTTTARHIMNLDEAIAKGYVANP